MSDTIYHRLKVCVQMCTQGCGRLWRNIVVKPFQSLPCFKCGMCDNGRQGKMMPVIFRNKTRLSTVELVDDSSEGEHCDDDVEDVDGVSRDEDDEVFGDGPNVTVNENRHQKKRLKRAGKAVRVFVGKGLRAYSSASLASPRFDASDYSASYGEIPVYYPTRDVDYYSASYGVYL